MTKEEIHKKNIGLYLSNGGDAKTAKALEYASLENRARLSFLLKENVEIRDKGPGIRDKELGVRYEKEKTPESSKPSGLGLIAQYPTELHKTYKKALDLWVEVCSLKIKLNDVPKQNEKTAFIVQTKILDKMDVFDECRKALHHYNEHKRILATETQTDYSDLTAMQILKKRNNIRVSITKRKKTITDHEKALPPKTDNTYYKLLSALNRKKEQLQELILDEKKLTLMIMEN